MQLVCLVHYIQANAIKMRGGICQNVNSDSLLSVNANFDHIVQLYILDDVTFLLFE